MPRKLRVIDLERGQFRKCRLQRRAKLRPKHAVDIVARIAICRVSRHIRVEKKRIHDVIAVLAEATNPHRQDLPRHIVEGFERHLRRRPVLVSQNFLHIEIVNALILAGIAAHRETFLDFLPRIGDARLEVARENRRLRRRIIHIFARLVADLDHATLLHDNHTLPVIHRDARTVGNDIVLAARIRTSPLRAQPFLPFDHERIRIDRIAVEKFLPLIAEHAADGAQTRFNQSHSVFLLCMKSPDPAGKGNRSRGAFVCASEEEIEFSFYKFTRL